MKIKILIVSAFLLCAGQSFAQAEKTEKKVVIIKKTIDSDGNETTEKTVLTGEEAADFEMKTEDGTEIKIKTDDDDKKTENEGVPIWQFIGDEDIEVSEETYKKLAEETIDINELMQEIFGEEKVLITEKNKKIEIEGDKMILINKDEKEIDVEKEIIIIDDSGKETKTRMKMHRKEPGADDGNTLNIKSLNINLDDNILTVNVVTEAAPLSVLVTDTDGEKIYRETLGKFDGTLDRKINLKKAAAGPIFLILKQGDKVFSERIVR